MTEQRTTESTERQNERQRAVAPAASAQATVARFPATPSREELLADEDGRIAQLTSGAIKQSGDKAARDVMAAVSEIEGIVKIIREDAETLAAEIKRHTEQHAVRVGRVIEDLRALSLAMREKRDSLIKTQAATMPPSQRAAE